MHIRGTVITGKGEAQRFISLTWVRKQLRETLNIEPYPGTFNLRIVPEDLSKLPELKTPAGIAIESPTQDFCSARAYPVKVCGLLYGAIIVPGIADYPDDQVEIVSEWCLRRELNLKNGDIIGFDVPVPGAK